MVFIITIFINNRLDFVGALLHGGNFHGTWMDDRLRNCFYLYNCLLHIDN